MWVVSNNGGFNFKFLGEEYKLDSCTPDESCVEPAREYQAPQAVADQFKSQMQSILCTNFSRWLVVDDQVDPYVVPDQRIITVQTEKRMYFEYAEFGWASDD